MPEESPNSKYIGFTSALEESKLSSSTLWKIVQKENNARQASGLPLLGRKGDLYEREPLFGAIAKHRPFAQEETSRARAHGLIRLKDLAAQHGLTPQSMRARCRRRGIGIEGGMGR